MASSGYQAWSVSAGEVPTTAYWNILGANDAAFNNGNGFNDGSIVTRHLAANAVSYITPVWSELVGTNQAYTSSYTTITAWNSGSFTTHGGTVLFDLQFSTWNNTSGALVSWRLILNGSGYVPNFTGSTFMINATSTHVPLTRTYAVTTLPAATYTVALQLKCNVGTGTVDSADWVNLTTIEVMA